VTADDRPDAGPPDPAASVPGEATSREAPDDVRLRDVIRHLLTPARAGIYLGRDDLARLGATLGFPLPALDRRIMLEHLFVAAGPAGLVPRLLDLLREETDAWIAAYADWERQYPHTAPIWQEWRARAEALQATLVDMQRDAEAARA
jgi:hypothetical protein